MSICSVQDAATVLDPPCAPSFRYFASNINPIPHPMAQTYPVLAALGFGVVFATYTSYRTLVSAVALGLSLAVCKFLCSYPAIQNSYASHVAGVQP